MNETIHKFKLTLSVIFLLMSFTCLSYAQEKTNRLNVNFQFNLFVSKLSQTGASFSILNPGIEILYELGLTEKVSLSAGTNYIFSSRNRPIGEKSQFREIAHEIFIPILLNTKLKNRFIITTGIYPGWLVKGKELYKNVMDVRKWIDVTEEYSDYSASQKFTADIYFGTGYMLQVSDKYIFMLTPFFKYKLSENWMGEVRNRTSFGIRVNYLFRCS